MIVRKDGTRDTFQAARPRRRDAHRLREAETHRLRCPLFDGWR